MELETGDRKSGECDRRGIYTAKKAVWEESRESRKEECLRPSENNYGVINNKKRGLKKKGE
jgi:hypothetical protein